MGRKELKNRSIGKYNNLQEEGRLIFGRIINLDQDVNVMRSKHASDSARRRCIIIRL